MMRVLLGDPHRSFVEALALRLAEEDAIHVVATVLRPEEAVRVVASEPIDMAVLSVGPGAGNFVSIGRQLLNARRGLKLVAIATEDDVALLAKAVAEGFRGWVPKDVGIASLLDVIYSVDEGETQIPSHLLGRLLTHLTEESESKRAAQEPLSGLTAREQQVLAAMVRGLSRPEIAEQLDISSNTVRTHMQNILNKLGVHSSLAAVALARRAGLV